MIKKGPYQKMVREIRKHASDNPILIYQMGKVGSTTLEASLNHAFHVHTLYGNEGCKFGANLRRPGLLGASELRAKYFLRRALFRRNKRLRIISPVREPLARNISAYFQELPFWLAKYVIENDIDTRFPEDNFLLDAYEKSFDHFYYDKWFDKEVKKFTGIDVFDHEFISSKGFQIIRHGKYELLLIKSERMYDLTNVLSEFTGQKVIWRKSNDAASKWYSSIYKEFKADKFRLEALASTKQIRCSKTARHFGYHIDER